MATIRTHTPRSKMPGIPDVNVGLPQRVTGADFGGESYRDWMRLGQAGQQAGNAVMQWGIREYEEQQQNSFRAANVELMRTVSEERNRISQLQGEAATTAKEDLRKFSTTEAERIRGTLKTNRAKELFDQRRMDFDLQNDMWADGFVAQRTEEARVTGLEAEKEQYIENGVANRDVPGAVAANIKAGQDNIAARHAGQPEQFIKNEQAKYAALTIEKVAAAYAEQQSPQAALDFLNSGVEMEVGDDATLKNKLAQLRTKYQEETIKAEQKAIINESTSEAIEIARAAEANGQSPEKAVQSFYAALVRRVGAEAAQKTMSAYNVYDELGDEARTEAQQAADRERQERERAEKEQEKVREAESEEQEAVASQKGRALAEDKSKSLAEARQEAYAEFPEKQAEIMIKAFEAERGAVKIDKAAQEIERKDKLGEELKAAGYNAANMPSFPDMSPVEQKEYLDLGNAILKSTTPEAQKVDEEYYLQLQFDASDEDVAAMFADPDKRNELVTRLGGVNSQQYKDIANRIKSARNGSGSSRGSGKINSLDTLLNNVKTEANIVFADTKRFTGSGASAKTDRDDAVNRIISFARKELESSMKRLNIDDVDALPLEERNRIISEALITRGEPGLFGGRTMTRAEAEIGGVDQEDWQITPASLPLEERAFYLAGDVEERGAKRINVNVPYSSLPQNIQATTRQIFGSVDRVISQGDSQGYYYLTPYNPDEPIYVFTPDGSTAVTIPRKKREAPVAVDAAAWVDQISQRAFEAGGLALR